jgi:dinuclear metal center YbgI/SA1388 family protein
MKISEIISVLESIADPRLQEQYDNAALITGEPDRECTGIICSLDATEEVIQEAISQKCNMVVSHHPIVFRGLKKLSGNSYVERAVILAIKNDIALYAIHTNLDNVHTGVNAKIAVALGLQKLSTMVPRSGTLMKLYTFVPAAQAEKLRTALFNAGAGDIGNYSECSFNAEGEGTFKPGEGTDPFVGKKGERHVEKETRIELIFPFYREKQILAALKKAHPYEEVAFDIIALSNTHPGIGSGLIGELPKGIEGNEFLQKLKQAFQTPVIRHTVIPAKPIQRVAICGGAGSFLIPKALSAKTDAYVTGDIKYHEFFDADSKMLLCDIGHYESERFTIDLLQEVLAAKFPTFAVRKTTVNTNPVRYF